MASSSFLGREVSSVPIALPMTAEAIESVSAFHIAASSSIENGNPNPH